MQEVIDRSQSRTGPAGRSVMNVLPLKEGVLFPTVVMPLFVGRSRSLASVKAALEKGREILLVKQREGDTEEPTLADLHSVGTVARILQTLPVSEGTMKVLVEGLYRARVVQEATGEETFSAVVESVPDVTASDLEAQALRRAALDRLAALSRASSRVPSELVSAVAEIPEPGKVADALAGHLDAPIPDKQAALEVASVERRLELALNMLEREIDIARVEKKIHGRVKKSVEKQSREHYLREQMKAIRKELGEDGEGEDELESLRNKLDAAKLPKAAADAARKELDRLAKLGPSSAEGSVIRNYLQVLAELPWSKRTKDRLDLVRARAILERDHSGLGETKDRVLDYLAVCQLKGKIRGPILCFAGPPGVGKTSMGRSIARALGRKFGRISLGGMRDEAEIRGHRRTYIGAMPGRLVQTLRRLGTANPVILLDEIDKTGSDWRGDTASALLEVLDPEQNSTFTDHFLEVPFDLSKVLFLTTANVIDMIPDALRDRMEIIRVAGYTEPEKIEIAERHLLPRQRKVHGIKPERLTVTRKALSRVIQSHTREAGVRELERKVAQLCRKAARALVERGPDGKPVMITSKGLEKWLGRDRFRTGAREKVDEIGVAMGLAWTPVGGTTLPIEAVAMPGTGKLILTGQLGQVMQESAQAAITFARKNADALGVQPGFHRDLDVHVHAPEGGIPKDGPSAGITIATAVVSALGGVPISKDVAMTGEITLRGRVLPVGGIKEKVLAAYRMGIRRLIMSEDNRRDLDDVPEDIRKRLDVTFVTHLSEVLAAALARPVQAGEAVSEPPKSTLDEDPGVGPMVASKEWPTVPCSGSCSPRSSS